jgi:dTDP-4-dehydrorhamnose 3,5-epimerase
MALVEIFDNVLIQDERGYLSKFVSFNDVLRGTPFSIQEVFKSKTSAGYVRGMHFQSGQSLNSRIIHLMNGHVLTYFIDLRPKSLTFGEFERIETPLGFSRTFLVPAGIAHGFLAISDCEVLYLSEKAHNPMEDLGVNPLSVEFEWPYAPRGVSKRDSLLPTLTEYLKNNS